MNYGKIRCKEAGQAEALNLAMDTKPCQACHGEMPVSFGFCGQCGEKLS